MSPPPVAIGLTLCDKIIVEEGTRKVTLVNTFAKIDERVFPSPPRTFFVFAVLTDARGDATIDVVMTSLNTNQVVYSRQILAHFPDPLQELRVSHRVDSFSFPAPGLYQFTILVNGAWVAQRRLRVLQIGS